MNDTSKLTQIPLKRKTEPSHRATSAIGLEKVHFQMRLEQGRDLKGAALDLTVDHREALIMLQMLGEIAEDVAAASNQPVTAKSETLAIGIAKAH